MDKYFDNLPYHQQAEQTAKSWKELQQLQIEIFSQKEKNKDETQTNLDRAR